MLPLVLASSSPYRHQLLRQLGLPFTHDSPNIDEVIIADEKPQQLVSRLATAKAQAIAGKHHHSLIIGSDQVATLGEHILTKPGNHSKATQQLRLCSNQTVVFYTGLTLLNTSNGAIQQHVESFTVHFRTLSNGSIDRYLRKEQPYDCAGSFKVEGLGICLFSKLEGDDPNSLIGLPLIKLITMLNNEGVDILQYRTTTNA